MRPCSQQSWCLLVSRFQCLFLFPWVYRSLPPKEGSRIFVASLSFSATGQATNMMMMTIVQEMHRLFLELPLTNIATRRRLHRNAQARAISTTPRIGNMSFWHRHSQQSFWAISTRHTRVACKALFFKVASLHPIPSHSPRPHHALRVPHLLCH